ncbi:oxygen-independent coproporphyrinogen III oxidase [Sporosarcina sp. BI001-red]|uniref:radical SAM family heme chaperone HemW n=1 Tax=Sporosarcina sp. BI001-red TaxID=2282866 RepID=UPI000E288F9D|nr:radical SAM family heme chaperone HemW [Sporosarcina sp. BI001-red]REB09972.1 oxygen-independent coproporphyrinogen III oxidase [Sporosarcina sp. BI001-red]
MRGIYIHIPFCHQICHYCDFNKVFFENQPVDEYIEMIDKELTLLKQSGSDFTKVETVFFGGGTPTALTAKQLDRLLYIVHSHINVKNLTEFSTEANPDELTLDKLNVLKNGQVKRLSLGVQSFDEGLLKKIGRSHSPKQAIDVVNNARRAGFENISIDLIYALPGQTQTQWKDTLDQALALELPHYSGYSLIIEPKTVFYNLMNKGRLPLPGEDEETVMFGELIDRMEQAGKSQYEISNFAIPGSESIHNMIYWENDEYAGIGAGAHGYLNGVRYANIAPLKRYMEHVETGELPRKEESTVTLKESMEEEMFLGLRKTEGVSVKHFAEKFGVSLEEKYGAVIQDLIQKDLVEQHENRIRLTRNGIFKGNEAFQQFLG